MKKLALILLALSTFTFADEDGKTICNKDDSQKASWMPMEKAKEHAAHLGYDVKDASISSGFCYEMLVVETKTGKKQEVYFNPTTMAKVKVKEIK